jgi:hypothetical protein
MTNDDQTNADPDAKDVEDPSNGTVHWNRATMQTTFANVVNIQGTREQIELFFGTSGGADPDPSGRVQVDVSNRMILTPYAAKRLNAILTSVLNQYEQRHGVLKIND